MSFDFKNMKEWARGAYDKLALFLTLFGLLVSVVLLLVFLEGEQQELTAARWELAEGAGKPASEIDLRDLYQAIERVSQPYQIADWTTRMMVAEIRTACVQCHRPIPFAAEACPYRNCGVVQPIAPQVSALQDSAGDGIPDEWKVRYGMNPLARVAHLDNDGDGFTNLEEYVHGTDPTDPESFPPPIIKLKALQTGRMPMPLSFQGIQRLTEEDMVFTVRNNTTHRDYYARLGEEVEGYLLLDFEPREDDVKRGNLVIRENTSILRVKRGDSVTPLTLGRGVGQGEPVAQMLFGLDDTKHLVKVDDTLNLKNIVYKIIDIQKDAVVVLDEHSGKETRIELQ